MRRAATKAEPAYDRLRTTRGAAAVFADETGWYVGGPGLVWDFVCDTARSTSSTRAAATGPPGCLGEDFAGMLVSDCLSSYDPLPYRKHKCIAHHQRAIAAARASPGTPTRAT